jgi:hypothetical protein
MDLWVGKVLPLSSANALQQGTAEPVFDKAAEGTDCDQSADEGPSPESDESDQEAPDIDSGSDDEVDAILADFILAQGWDSDDQTDDGDVEEPMDAAAEAPPIVEDSIEARDTVVDDDARHPEAASSSGGVGIAVVPVGSLPPLEDSRAGGGGSGVGASAADEAAEHKPKQKSDRFLWRNGEIHLRKHAEYADAHCNLCGCKMDRKLKKFDPAERSAKAKRRQQGRPLGMQLLWLSYDCKGNADDHKNLANRWLVTPGMKFAERCQARTEGMADPSLTELFQQERPAWPEEDRGEPHSLCGL